MSANNQIIQAIAVNITCTSNRRIQDIEGIDITGSGNNILTLNLDELLDASTSTNILATISTGTVACASLF
jgi:hypothetical protein